ncbi:MAG: hypothetical protein ACOC6F_01155 [bacterium]
MTHTLHRQGDVKSLQEDYLLLMLPAPGFNRQGSAEKLRQFLEIALHHDPANYGVVGKGSKFTVSTAELMDLVGDGDCVHAVFSSRESFEAALQQLKRRDLGISVTATGLLEDIRLSCACTGLAPHTIQYSLGIGGNRDKYMPAGPVLEITSMCGHGLVPAALVQEMISAVSAGKRTPEEAAAELARLCPCGVFNPVRAAHLIRDQAEAGKHKGD